MFFIAIFYFTVVKSFLPFVVNVGFGLATSIVGDSKSFFFLNSKLGDLPWT